MEVEDRRSDEEKTTLTVIVSGIDPFMTDLGHRAGRIGPGVSVAAWACRESDADRVAKWVRARGDLKNIRVSQTYFRPNRIAHVSIYPVREGHPALEA